MLVNYENVMR
jgi:hypothetical protein